MGFAEVGGRRVSLRWRLKSVRQKGHRLTVVFACPSPRLLARSDWVGDAGPGPIEHTLSIENQSAHSIAIPLQPSLNWSFKPRAGHQVKSWWVEKGAGGPSEQGVHVTTVDSRFHQDLESRPYVDDERAYAKEGSNRDPIPWICLHDETSQDGCYAGIEFSGRVSLALRSDLRGVVSASTGLCPDHNGFRSEVRPGETYALPTVFVGCFKGSVDDGANRMRRWVTARLRPKASDPRYPLVTLNSWGSGMAVDAPLAKSMMLNAAKLGIEMFHVDAGWFRGVGDWRPNPQKFPQGLRAISDEAHALGLKFGLWVVWSQVGIRPEEEDPQAVINVHSGRSDWFAKDYPPDWKPADFTGADLCLGDPKAVDWCKSLLSRLVDEYNLDLLEHDQRMIVQECNKKDHLHTPASTDVAYRAAQGYYAVYDKVRREHPKLLFEDCVNGGRMVDFGVIKRTHYVSITDSYYPLANRRAFFDASYVLPPSMCECYIEAQPVKTLGEFVSMLRSGMMGLCTIMQDPAKWTGEQSAAAKRQFQLYKTRLRPLIRHGNLFHVSERPDGKRWDGIQYASQDRSKGVLYAFRGDNDQDKHTFLLKGLDAKGTYRIHFEDGSHPDTSVGGKELMERGLEVYLTARNTSQLAFITRI